MFKLRRLEITGFKSFADQTDLIFTGEGITAIVGPNGCGKSNVADAIAWVLGEQRVKHLRGAAMLDVIFQGSRNRAPSGMSEVVLHLVRDETGLDDADVDDIDSTLEEIDEQSEAVEEKLLPEITGVSDGDATAAPADASMVDASASVADAPQGELLVAPAGEVVSTDNTADAALTPEALTTKAQHAHHKRHWRPRRMALDFAP